MIPQIQTATASDNVITQIEVTTLPSKTYKDRDDKIIGKTDSLNAVIQTIKHILNKERYAYVIYDDWYGMELEKYKGQSFEYLQAQIANDLTEALMQDDRITSVEVTTIEKVGIDSAHVVFNVYSTEGVIENQEMTVDV